MMSSYVNALIVGCLLLEYSNYLDFIWFPFLRFHSSKTNNYLRVSNNLFFVYQIQIELFHNIFPEHQFRIFNFSKNTHERFHGCSLS